MSPRSASTGRRSPPSSIPPDRTGLLLHLNLPNPDGGPPQPLQRRDRSRSRDRNAVFIDVSGRPHVGPRPSSSHIDEQCRRLLMEVNLSDERKKFLEGFAAARAHHAAIWQGAPDARALANRAPRANGDLGRVDDGAVVELHEAHGKLYFYRVTEQEINDLKDRIRPIVTEMIANYAARNAEGRRLSVEDVIAHFDETANHSGQSMSYKEAMIEPIMWFSLAYIHGFPEKCYTSSSTFTHKVSKGPLALFNGLAALCIQVDPC